MLRRLVLKIHLYLSLASLVFLVIVSATGALLVYLDPIDRLLNPHLTVVQPGRERLSLAAITAAAQRANPARRVIRLQLPERDDLSYTALLQDGTRVHVNGDTGEILGARHLQSGPSYYLSSLHTSLLLTNRSLGRGIVGWANVALLVISVTGLVLWWRRKLFVPGTSGGWRRVNLDLHHVSGVYALILVVVIGGTGVMLSFPAAVNPAVWAVTGAPAPVTLPKPIVRKGAAMITPDQAVEAARAALPGARPTWVGVGPVTSVDLKFPEDGTPAGRSHVFLDPYTGQVLLVQNTRAAHAATAVRNATRMLHTGDIWGWPSQFAWCAACLALVVQAVTGLLIWWKPKQAAAAGRR